jgi:hypothetical protein
MQGCTHARGSVTLLAPSLAGLAPTVHSIGVSEAEYLHGHLGIACGDLGFASSVSCILSPGAPLAYALAVWHGRSSSKVVPLYNGVYDNVHNTHTYGYSGIAIGPKSVLAYVFGFDTSNPRISFTVFTCYVRKKRLK